MILGIVIVLLLVLIVWLYINNVRITEDRCETLSAIEEVYKTIAKGMESSNIIVSCKGSEILIINTHDSLKGSYNKRHFQIGVSKIEVTAYDTFRNKWNFIESIDISDLNAFRHHAEFVSRGNCVMFNLPKKYHEVLSR